MRLPYYGGSDCCIMEGAVVPVFVVEHMEPYLFEWCLSEYKAMKDYLAGTPARLLITNAKAFLDYEGEHAPENQRHVQELLKSFCEDSQKYQLQRESLQEAGQGLLKGSVCMLDMRGEQPLSPGQQWDYVVFGGVLGDHPPRDRPAPLRQHFGQIRHLGALQLATDTAVLVSRLILCNHLPLTAIPMIEAPTVRGVNGAGEKTTVQMEGFSYVSRELDIGSGKLREGLSKKEKREIYMSEGVRALLLRDDLDQQLLM